jgi:aspartate/methionine/tyrosine aminotransferase
MAGWRVGMIAGRKEYLSEILKFKSNMDSGMFLPLQLAAVKALNLSSEWYGNLNRTYRERQHKVFQIMDLLGCEYDKEQGGMFVWAKVPVESENGFKLSDRLLNDAHVFVTPGGIFGSNGNQFIRISLCNKLPVFDETINRINKIIA